MIPIQKIWFGGTGGDNSIPAGPMATHAVSHSNPTVDGLCALLDKQQLAAETYPDTAAVDKAREVPSSKPFCVERERNSRRGAGKHSCCAWSRSDSTRKSLTGRHRGPNSKALRGSRFGPLPPRDQDGRTGTGMSEGNLGGLPSDHVALSEPAGACVLAGLPKGFSVLDRLFNLGYLNKRSNTPLLRPAQRVLSI
jgi:hypothetical protein